VKLRLLLFEECNRNCRGCCNKDWDLKALPQVKTFKGFDEILLTGGEPMLHPIIVKKVSNKIYKQNEKTKIYMYTAKVDNLDDMICIMPYLNGITLTLHVQKDVDDFLAFNQVLIQNFLGGIDYLSLRLNIFEKVTLAYNDLFLWKIKDNIKWMKNCPLPKNEIFMRL